MFVETPRKKLWNLIDQKSLIIGKKLVLSASASSLFYFDCKPITLDGEGLNLVAEAFLEKIDTLSEYPTAIGGLTLGADFIVAAVVMRAYQVGHTIHKGSIVRKQPKEHGIESQIENMLSPGTSIVVVDDVITTGRSIAIACDNFIKVGYHIIGIIVLIDRETGGANMLQQTYKCPVLAIYKKSDFPRALDNNEVLEDEKSY